MGKPPPFAPWLFWAVVCGFAMGFASEVFLRPVHPSRFGDFLLPHIVMGLVVCIGLSAVAWRLIPWTPKP
jgi:hypothetical protein